MLFVDARRRNQPEVLVPQPPRKLDLCVPLEQGEGSLPRFLEEMMPRDSGESCRFGTALFTNNLTQSAEIAAISPPHLTMTGVSTLFRMQLRSHQRMPGLRLKIQDPVTM